MDGSSSEMKNQPVCGSILKRGWASDEVCLSVAEISSIHPTTKKPSNHKHGSSWAIPGALVSLLHIPNHLETPSISQHILDNSLTLVKFSFKIWSLLSVTEFPSPSADICLTLLLKVTLCHLPHYWVGVKLLCLKEATFLLCSYSML